MTNGVSRRAILRTVAAVAIGAPLAARPAAAGSTGAVASRATGRASAAQATARPTAAGPAAAVQAPTPRKAPTVELFAHRGACASWPEHTFGSYVQAIADGADYVEPDLVCTRDGVLVARHENNIVETTDVVTRPDFASRRTTKTVDGKVQTGWFVEDFSLAELKTLRAIERLPRIRAANTRYDGLFQIPTWDELIELVAAESLTRNRVIGLVPEIKSSTYFASIGLPMEDRFLRSLADHAYTRKAPVEIQSFEIGNLQSFHLAPMDGCPRRRAWSPTLTPPACSSTLGCSGRKITSSRPTFATTPAIRPAIRKARSLKFVVTSTKA
jgi:glycerophosphoryl diester phosphodiesterase